MMKINQIIDDTRLSNPRVVVALVNKLNVPLRGAFPADYERPVLRFSGKELQWWEKSRLIHPVDFVHLDWVLCPTCLGTGSVFNGEDEPEMQCPKCEEGAPMDISRAVWDEIGNTGTLFLNSIISVKQETRHVAPIGNTNHYMRRETVSEYCDPDLQDRLDILTMQGFHAIRGRIDEEIIRTMSLTPKVLDLACRPIAEIFPALSRSLLQGLTHKDLFEDQVYAAVSWDHWSSLCRIEQFAKAPYLTEAQLVYKKTQAKTINGVTWFPTSGLPRVGGCQSAFIYASTSVTHVLNNQIEVKFDPEHGDIDGHFEHISGLSHPDRILRLVTK